MACFCGCSKAFHVLCMSVNKTANYLYLTICIFIPRILWAKVISCENADTCHSAFSVLPHSFEMLSYIKLFKWFRSVMAVNFPFRSHAFTFLFVCVVAFAWRPLVHSLISYLVYNIRSRDERDQAQSQKIVWHPRRGKLVFLFLNFGLPFFLSFLLFFPTLFLPFLPSFSSLGTRIDGTIESERSGSLSILYFNYLQFSFCSLLFISGLPINIFKSL